MIRLARLPEAELDDFFKLAVGWTKAKDPEERQSYLRAMDEILAQAPITTTPMPLEREPRIASPGLKKWAEHVGARIRSLREQAGLTQAQLAERAGLTQSHVSRLENAEHSATHLTLEKLAKALDVPVRELDVCLD
jgi:ribosome-binding protein aMBF1 (putative translation factor)